MAKKAGREAIVMIRMTEAERRELERAAERASLPVSAWVRMKSLEAARAAAAPKS